MAQEPDYSAGGLIEDPLTSGSRYKETLGDRLSRLRGSLPPAGAAIAQPVEWDTSHTRGMELSPSEAKEAQRLYAKDEAADSTPLGKPKLLSPGGGAMGPVPSGGAQAAKPRPWNDIARGLDPWMPQEQYNDLKFQYFSTYVRPYVPPQLIDAYWQDFDSKTQRPKAIESPHLAQAKLAMLSAGTRAQELLHTNPTFKAQRDALVQMMQRDGVPYKGYAMIGDQVPELLAFAGMEAATGGVGGLLAEGAEAGSFAMRAAQFLKGVGLRNAMAKGGLTWGTMDVLMKQQGAPIGYTFLKGAAFGVIGGAAESMIFGKAAEAGAGRGAAATAPKATAKDKVIADLSTPKDTSQEVDSMLSTPGVPAADKAQAANVAGDAERARQTAKPFLVKIDNTRPGVYFAVDVGGKPVTIPVAAGAEARATATLQDLIKKGGTLIAVQGHENNQANMIHALAALGKLEDFEGTSYDLAESMLNKHGQQVPILNKEEYLQGMMQAAAEHDMAKAAAAVAEEAGEEEAVQVGPGRASGGGITVESEGFEEDEPYVPPVGVPVGKGEEVEEIGDEMPGIIEEEPEEPGPARPSMVKGEPQARTAAHQRRKDYKAPSRDTIFANLIDLSNRLVQTGKQGFTQSQIKIFGGKIARLWLETGPRGELEAVAHQLRGLGMENMVPREYRPIVRMPALKAEELRVAQQRVEVVPPPPKTQVAKTMITRRDEADLRGLGYNLEQINKMKPEEAGDILAMGRRAPGTRPVPKGTPEQLKALGYTDEEIRKGATAEAAPKGDTEGQVPHNGKWKLTHIIPKFVAGMSNKDIAEETGLKQSRVEAWRSTWNNMKKRGGPSPDSFSTTPTIDTLRVALDKPKLRRNIIDIVMNRKGFREAMGDGAGVSIPFGSLDNAAEYGFPNARVAGVRILPGDLAIAEARESLYHEDLHIQTGLLAGEDGRYWTNILHTVSPASAKAMYDIGKKVAEIIPFYTQHGVEGMMEEVFVQAASAIRVGNKRELLDFARWDTSLDHVRGMVDDMARELHLDVSTRIDAQELRHFSTRLEDLMRRTGPMRFSRWSDEAFRQEYSMFYDVSRGGLVLGGEGRGRLFLHDTAEALQHAIAEALDEKAHFVESVPSSTTLFEQMGFRGPIMERRVIRQGLGDKPTPAFLPKSGFRGWSAFTALFTPMMAWAAKLDEKFVAAGHDIGLFPVVKDLDDGVRRGAEWQRDKIKTFGDIIGHDEEHAKLLTQFMQAEYTAWPDMAKKLVPEAQQEEFLGKVRAMRKELTEFQQFTGIQVNNYLQKDLMRLQNFNFAPSSVWPAGLDASERARIPRAIINGEINPQDPHIGHFLSWLLKEGMTAKFLEPNLYKLDKILALKDEAGKSLLGASRFNLDNYSKYIRGVPDVTQQAMLQAVGDFQKGLGRQIDKFNAKFGTKINSDFNYPGNFLQKYMLLSYVGSIGMRPAVWARDAIQAVTNALPVLGPTKFMKGVTALFQKGTWEEANEAGATLGRHTVYGQYGDIFSEMHMNQGRSDKLIEQAGRLLSVNRWMHNITRVSTYKAEYDAALQGIRDVRANKISFDDLMRDRTAMWFYDKPLQMRFQQQILERAGKTTTTEDVERLWKEELGRRRELEARTKRGEFSQEYFDAEKSKHFLSKEEWLKQHPVGEPNFLNKAEDVAKKIALETVDHTLWAYRRGTQPLFLRTGIGRMFGQYGLWPMSYMDFLRRLTVKTGEHPKQAIQALGWWAAANTAATQSFSAAGGDVGKWFFISPAGFGGSPHLQMAQAIGQAMENSEQGRAARKTILEYPMNFIPAYLEGKNVANFISQGGDFFTSDWQLTPEAAKVMGMHPKSKDLDLTPEEWVEYQSGFTHRR